GSRLSGASGPSSSLRKVVRAIPGAEPSWFDRLTGDGWVFAQALDQLSEAERDSLRLGLVDGFSETMIGSRIGKDSREVGRILEMAIDELQSWERKHHAGNRGDRP